MIINIPETVSLPGGAVTELINLGDGDAALLYIYLTTCGGDLSSAQKDMSWSYERARFAFKKLVSQNLVSDESKADGTKTSESDNSRKPVAVKRDALSEMQIKKQFSSLVQEVQGLFARMLSSDELVRLFGIYDSLGMPPEVILQLVVYCMAETGEREGGAAMPSMKYIEKAAYTWDREGIYTLELAEQYIKDRAARKNESAKIKTQLQIYGRNFAPLERKYVDDWMALGYTSEAIAIAYDRTITKTGKLTWNYMNSIIKSWYSKGLITPEDILAKDTRRLPSSRFGLSGGSGSPDDKEVDRINRILKGLNEEK